MSYCSPLIFEAPFKRLSYFIAFREEDLIQTLQQNGFSTQGLAPHEYAESVAVTFQKWEDGQRVNAVYFKIPQTAPCSPKNISAIIHEGIHIVEDILDRMGEARASEEFRAYLTEEVCRCLIGEFLTYIGVTYD